MHASDSRGECASCTAWRRRYEAAGRDGLRDHSARPHRSPRRVAAALARRIRRLRAQRRSGPPIGDALAVPLSTVGDVLRRLGLGGCPR
jgi:leucine-zipper of insertion element IS481